MTPLRFEVSDEASVRLGHKSLRTLMKRSSSWYLPGWCVSSGSCRPGVYKPMIKTQPRRCSEPTTKGNHSTGLRIFDERLKEQETVTAGP